MRKIFALIVLLSLQNYLQAQSKKLDIKIELNKIYREFEKKDSELNKKYLVKYKSLLPEKDENRKLKLDSLYRIDYKNYYQELQPYNKVKREALKKLLEKLNNENPLVGKFTIYVKDDPKDVEKIKIAQKNPDYADFEFMGILKSEEKDLVIDLAKINKIRTDFSNNFDSSLFLDAADSVLSAKIAFILDADGYLKKIKPMEGNEEFAYLCAITLYQMQKRYEPNKYKGKPILTRYALPVKMQFK